jgi:hypothetical protein
MAFIVDTETGEMILYQGDSGELFIRGLNTDKNYTVYFAFYNKKRRRLGTEISIETNQSDHVNLSIPASLTDLLTVPLGLDSEEYYYGIKVCDSVTNYEDTSSVGNKGFGDLNIVTVYPKEVEGL